VGPGGAGAHSPIGGSDVVIHCVSCRRPEPVAIAYGLVRFDASFDAIPNPAIRRVFAVAQRAAGPGFAVQLGGAQVQRWRTRHSAGARRSGFRRLC
jgi:hypothetical protein